MSNINRNTNYDYKGQSKAVTFNDGRYRSQPNLNTKTESMGDISTLNRGHSSNNLYWGTKHGDTYTYNTVMTENQSKFIQDRISSVERHFGDLCTNFGAYTRKLGRLRDKGDELGRSLLKYAEHENLNHTTKEALRDFCENFGGVQDYREHEVKSLESKVVTPLTNYGHQCKVAKEQLKKAFTARDREVKQRKKLENVKDKKPSDRHTISRAETDLSRASNDATHSSRLLEEEIDRFEKQKLHDIKTILTEFVNTELVYHAKALEMYTICFQSLNTIDEQEDLEEFRNSLRPPASRVRLQQMQRTGSRTSLNSTGQSKSLSQGTPPRHGQRRVPADVNDTMNTTGASQYTTNDEDDEEDDDSEEETVDDSEEEESDDEETETATQSAAPAPVTKRPQLAAGSQPRGGGGGGGGSAQQKKQPQYSMFQAQSPQTAQRKK